MTEEKKELDDLITRLNNRLEQLYYERDNNIKTDMSPLRRARLILGLKHRRDEAIKRRDSLAV